MFSTKMWCQSKLGWGLYCYQYKDVVPVKLGVGTIWLSVQRCGASQTWGRDYMAISIKMWYQSNLGWGLYGYQYKVVVPVKFGGGDYMAISTKMWYQSNLGWGLYGYQYKDVVPVKLRVGTAISTLLCSRLLFRLMSKQK